MRTEPLRWWNIEQLVAIERELFAKEAWSSGMFWSELAAGHYYRVAVEDDEILGYAGLAVAGDEAWVNNIAVRAASQRRGIGAVLMEELLDEAARRGCRQIALEVATDNHAAQAMYDRYGFEAVGVRRGYYQPSNKDALVMMRPVHRPA